MSLGLGRVRGGDGNRLASERDADGDGPPRLRALA